MDGWTCATVTEQHGVSVQPRGFRAGIPRNVMYIRPRHAEWLIDWTGCVP